MQQSLQPTTPAGTETPVLNEIANPILGAGKLPQALSPWSMFMNADILVKAIMIGLAFASFVTWTIFFGKSIELLVASRRLRKALARIFDTRTLSEAQLATGRQENVVSTLLAAAMHEIELSADSGAGSGLSERIASSFADILRVEARLIRRGMGLLATIGSTAPFVGLFGTVWGIMNSFIGISKAQTTNLAVVAPGIAEALLATAIGLAAAIPAVIIYNHFSRQTRAYLDLAKRACGAVERLASRDLDRIGGRMRARAAE
jgi:biopolymer transport protein ExbB